MVLQYYKEYRGFQIEVTDQGHTFLTLIVAFLLVSRANTSMERYNKNRNFLSMLFAKTRELTHLMVIFSSDNINQSGKEWRHEIAYLTMLLLRSVMCTIDYESERQVAWDLPEMDETVRKMLKKNLYLNDDNSKYRLKARTSEREENMRVPIRLSLKVRQAIMAQRTKLSKPFSLFEELKLLTTIDQFMNGFYGIRKFLTTPFPFPLVQMARTFLFCYVFTVPFALLSDSSKPVAHCIVIFFLTYGFMGLEYVSIELDDPFGGDPNDFDNGRMATVAFEETYLSIVDIDGQEWTDKLRRKMDSGRNTSATPTEAFGWLHSGVEA